MKASQAHTAINLIPRPCFTCSFCHLSFLFVIAYRYLFALPVYLPIPPGVKLGRISHWKVTESQTHSTATWISPRCVHGFKITLLSIYTLLSLLFTHTHTHARTHGSDVWTDLSVQKKERKKKEVGHDALHQRWLNSFWILTSRQPYRVAKGRTTHSKFFYTKNLKHEWLLAF